MLLHKRRKATWREKCSVLLGGFPQPSEGAREGSLTPMRDIIEQMDWFKLWKEGYYGVSQEVVEERVAKDV